jgi:PAS domain S-box-containing protein
VIGQSFATARARVAGMDPLAVVAGLLAVGMGLMALVGWLLGIDALKSIIPGLLTMKVNTAIALVLLGSGLVLRALPGGTFGHRVAIIPALLAVMLAILVGSQYVLQRDLGVDQWLFREAPGQIGTVAPNRMSPMTAVSIIAVGLAIALSAGRRASRAVPTLALGAVLIGLLNVFDWAFDAETPSIFAGWTQMALMTALAVIILGVGTFGLLPRRGPLNLFMGDSSTARLARRLTFASVAVPIGLAWLRVQGESRGLYGSNYGTSLIVLGTLVFLGLVIWHTAGSARRIELERVAALEERDRFFEVSKDLLVTAGADGYFMRLNPAWTATLGHDLETLTSRPYVEFIHPDDVEATAREVDRQVRDGESVFNFQNRYRHRDGTFRWLEWTSAASDDGSRLYAVARDVTTRKIEEERLLAPSLARERRMTQARERVRSIIEARAFGPVYQPVLDLARGSIVGFEALTRFTDGWPPAEAFATAAECGLGTALEQATLAAAVEAARDLPRAAWLSLNVSPTMLGDVDRLRPLLGAGARPLVLEVTENETIAAYGPVRAAVRRLGPGIRMAVDDAGAGVANFNHLVELRPDFVKIDAGLVRGVDVDVGRQAVVAAILHFAAASPCVVIAEGIETVAERETLRGLGVRLGQGFLLARPAPVEAWAAWSPPAAELRPSRGWKRARSAQGGRFAPG